ncbi:unnamed protein product [Sphenostylis stenocarpa]|uniref:Uncharacterized protein n=1 Tax=Sphenostylis stenocarpa TaxID=92480 RepID=A0AA86RZY2_9FABA|nr:unnamed protein product [Sphenostylis stenocarpa]
MESGGDEMKQVKNGKGTEEGERWEEFRGNDGSKNVNLIRFVWGSSEWAGTRQARAWPTPNSPYFQSPLTSCLVRPRHYCVMQKLLLLTINYDTAKWKLTYMWILIE